MNNLVNNDQWTDEQQKQLASFLTPNGGIPPPAGVGTPSTPPPDLASRAMDPVEMADNATQESRIADSHPIQQPSPMATYVDQQKQQLNKWGPDQEQAVVNSVLKDRSSLGNRIGMGMTGFADALMQGVARAGNPGFQKQFADNMNANDKIRLDSIPKLQEMNMSQLGANQKLDAMNGQSPLGSSMAPATSAFLEMAGVPKEKIPAMLQNPEQTLKVLDSFKEMIPNQMRIKIDDEMKMLGLQLQKATLQNTERHDKAQEDIETTNQEMQHPVLNWLRQRGVLDSSSKGSSSGSSSPSEISTKSQYDALPSGSVYKFNGITHKKK